MNDDTITDDTHGTRVPPPPAGRLATLAARPAQIARMIAALTGVLAARRRDDGRSDLRRAGDATVALAASQSVLVDGLGELDPDTPPEAVWDRTRRATRRTRDRYYRWGALLIVALAASAPAMSRGDADVRTDLYRVADALERLGAVETARAGRLRRWARPDQAATPARAGLARSADSIDRSVARMDSVAGRLRTQADRMGADPASAAPAA